MNKRYFIPFLLCLTTLIASEYVLITEVFNNQRFTVLVIAIIALLCSVIFCWHFYRKFQLSSRASA